MIRQAISCDICGAEKKQTNHWFVAYENGGELRVSGWSSRNRLHPGTKHLCGQTCLHKLVDDFMARTLAARLQPVAANVVEEPVAGTDTSLTSASAYVDEVESSARLLTPPAPVLPKRSPFVVPAERVAGPGKFQVEECAPPFDDSPRYASRNWHAEAWDRERERELRAVERRPDIAVRRRSNA